MTPHGLIDPEACFTGIHAERNAPEADSHHASRAPEYYPQQKNEILTQDKFQPKCILEEVCRKHFPNAPPALPPCQIPDDISSKADPKFTPISLILSHPTEARDFERHAHQQGCNFHSPKLTVWSGLCHVPSVPEPAPAGRNILI